MFSPADQVRRCITARIKVGAAFAGINMPPHPPRVCIIRLCLIVLFSVLPRALINQKFLAHRCYPGRSRHVNQHPETQRESHADRKLLKGNHGAPARRRWMVQPGQRRNTSSPGSSEREALNRRASVSLSSPCKV